MLSPAEATLRLWVGDPCGRAKLSLGFSTDRGGLRDNIKFKMINAWRTRVREGE